MAHPSSPAASVGEGSDVTRYWTTFWDSSVCEYTLGLATFSISSLIITSSKRATPSASNSMKKSSGLGDFASGCILHLLSS